ncbi:hypothetical protein D9M70_482920 [compost metagenome]
MSLDVSAAQRRIEGQLAQSIVYLHKPTNTRYRLAFTISGTNELHPISGSCKYATDDQLANAEVWEKQ